MDGTKQFEKCQRWYGMYVTENVHNAMMAAVNRDLHSSPSTMQLRGGGKGGYRQRTAADTRSI